MLAPSDQTWPSLIWLVRHGESAGNVARQAAESSGIDLIDIAQRDMDVPLSPLGERQARALGSWFAARPVDERPTVVLSSPYIRAVQTVALVLGEAKIQEASLIRLADERLREKEFGILDRLTTAGIQQKFPEQAEIRSRVGKFYYRPPGGESWCDVILRLRSVLDHIQLQYRRERLLIVTHQIIVLCFRYLLERMSEQQVLAIDHDKDVANCSITSYQFVRAEEGRGDMSLQVYNASAPLEVAGEAVTTEPDAVVAPR